MTPSTLAEAAPALHGSRQQVAWAEDIRDRLMTQALEFRPAEHLRHDSSYDTPADPDGAQARARIREWTRLQHDFLVGLTRCDSASWYIDHRNMSTSGLILTGQAPLPDPLVSFPASARGYDGPQSSCLLLETGRWAGCTVTVPDSWITAGTETVDVRFRPGTQLTVADGPITNTIPVGELVDSLIHPTAAVRLEPQWQPGRWQTAEVASGCLSWYSEKASRLTLLDTGDDTLSVIVPTSWAKAGRTPETRALILPTDGRLTLTDGLRTTTLSTRECFEALTSPTPIFTSARLPQKWQPTADYQQIDISASQVTAYSDRASLLAVACRDSGDYSVLVPTAWVRAGRTDESRLLNVPTQAALTLSDGYHQMPITTEVLYTALTDPAATDFPAVVPQQWVPDALIQRVEVARADLGEYSEMASKLTLTCSQAEGLHITIPTAWVHPARDPWRCIIAFPTDTTFVIRGGAQRRVWSGRDFWTDRAHPLAEPGESLAVPQTTWESIEFGPGHIRPLKHRPESVMVRFPETHEVYPAAVVFHPAILVRGAELRAPEGWEWTLVTETNDRLKLTITELRGLLGAWSQKPATRFIGAPTRKVREFTPSTLTPVQVGVLAALADELDISDGEEAGA